MRIKNHWDCYTLQECLKRRKVKEKKLEALDVGSSPPSQAEARAEAGPCELPRVSMRERFTKPDW
jgi:hypothetical protein